MMGRSMTLLLVLGIVLAGCGGDRPAATPVACTADLVDARLRDIQTGAWRDFAAAANGWTTQQAIATIESTALPAAKTAREQLAAEDWVVCGIDVKPHALAAADAAIAGMEAAVSGDHTTALQHYDTSRAEMQLLDADWAAVRATAQ